MSRKSRDQRGQFRTMVRYDGRGRIIPGGNILKKGQKPQEGNWQAKEAYECCNVNSFKMTITSPDRNPSRFDIPLFNNERYDFTINWGDGTIESILIENTTGDQIIDHVYSSVDQYQISINGTFPGFTYIEDGNPTLIDSIDSWGDIAWSSMEGMFDGAINMVYNATDVPDLSNVTDMSSMFNRANNFNGDISGWDVSNVTDMNDLLDDAFLFNQDLSSWDVSNVTNMSFMFQNASSFNQDLSSWDVSNVTEMSRMFNDATSYNQDLSSWDVSGVTSCFEFSAGATSWVQPQPTFTSCTP